MKFFFDRNLSCHIARMLGHFDRSNNLVHQDDDGRFSFDSEDVDIISRLSQEGPKPVWITADIGQMRRPNERAALRDSGMTIFFCRRNNAKPHFQALKMLAIWPTVVTHAENTRVPTAFEIPFGRIGGQLNEKIVRIGHTHELFKNA